MCAALLGCVHAPLPSTAPLRVIRAKHDIDDDDEGDVVGDKPKPKRKRKAPGGVPEGKSVVPLTPDAAGL